MGDRRGKYRLDAPWALTGLLIGTILLLALAAVSFVTEILAAGVVFLAGAAYTLASAASHLYTARRGKFAVWGRELDRLDGGEDLLDLGCGRGAVLLLAARRLTSGRATGVDPWRSAKESAARANAEAEGVSDRVDLVTADLGELPFGDGRFDVVVSALALHRRSAAGRAQALGEAYRVVRPGGLLLIADVRHAPAYEAVLRGLGAREVRGRDLGWRYWHGGPWAGTCMIEARKPGEASDPATG